MLHVCLFCSQIMIASQQCSVSELLLETGEDCLPVMKTCVFGAAAEHLSRSFLRPRQTQLLCQVRLQPWMRLSVTYSRTSSIPSATTLFICAFQVIHRSHVYLVDVNYPVLLNVDYLLHSATSWWSVS